MGGRSSEVIQGRGGESWRSQGQGQGRSGRGYQAGSKEGTEQMLSGLWALLPLLSVPQ